MKVIRLRVQQHPLLVDAAIFLAGLEVPRELEGIACGDLRADLAAGPPSVDRPRPVSYRRQMLSKGRPSWLPDGVGLRGLNYYPPGGAGVGWHTDSICEGWRVYMGRPLGERPGLFLWAGGESASRLRCYDAPGVATAFYVSGRPGESWHAVQADCARLSLGLHFRSPEVARALGLHGNPA